jgi:hypothetical protein
MSAGQHKINWQYADLFFRISPVALLAVGMITLLPNHLY